MINEIIDIKADELILDINPMVLISLIKDYNKGNQLWMVKTKESILIETLDKKSKEDQLKEMEKVAVLIKEDAKIISKTVVVAKTKAKPKVYNYKWYRPKVTTVQKSAVIDYSQPDDKKTKTKAKTKSVEIVINPGQLCKKIKNNLVVGNVNYYYIRDEASTKSKVKKLLQRNVVIPYIKKVAGWYKTCDGLFVSEKVVKPITYKQAVKRIGVK